MKTAPTAEPPRAWRPAERAQFHLPREQPVSDWSAATIVLGQKIGPRPGPFRPDAWQVELLNLWPDPDVEHITIIAPAQCGKSTVVNVWLAWTVEHKPGPTLVVMPADKYAVRRMRSRIRPMFEDSRRLRRHLLGSRWAKDEADLSRMHLWMTGANSAAALADISCCYVILDEVGKFKLELGRESDPVSLAKHRSDAYQNRRKIATTSTPSRSEDLICREMAKSTSERFWVPCPDCGRHQVLEWSRVRWPSGTDPDEIEAHALAWYECAHCKAKIDDTPQNRRAMVDAGIWCPDCCEIDERGELAGELPAPSHRGFWVSGLITSAWSRLACTFRKAGRDPVLLRDFFNSDLGEPFDDQVAATHDDDVRRLEVSYPRGTVPADALCVTAGVDVRSTEIHYVLRAWSKTDGYLVDHGIVYGFGDLETALFGQLFERRDGDGDPLECMLACVDAGWRPKDTIEFCRRQPTRARPIKGEDQIATGAIFKAFTIDKGADGKPLPGGMQRWHLNGDYLHRELNNMIAPPDDGPPRLHNYPGLPEEYHQHLVAEHLVELRAGGQVRHVWRKKPGYGSPHFRDCERYALAAAEMLFFRHRAPAGPPPAPRPRPATAGRGRGGWIRGRGDRRRW